MSSRLVSITVLVLFAGCELIGEVSGYHQGAVGGGGSSSSTTSDGGQTSSSSGAGNTGGSTGGEGGHAGAGATGGDGGEGGMLVAGPCGNDVTNAGEDCDDGSQDADGGGGAGPEPQNYDGCTNDCQDEAPHLLISELGVRPGGGEFVEIYNPAATQVELQNYYLTTWHQYYEWASNGTAPSGGKFIARFPDDNIPGNGFVTVSFEGATEFKAKYGPSPNYDFEPGQQENEDGVMTGPEVMKTGTSLDDNKDFVLLFYWSGNAADPVEDVDYVFYSNATCAGADAFCMSKQGVSGYANDTPKASQLYAPPPPDGSPLQRCDTDEVGTNPSFETLTGGNGIADHDETSEDLDASFKTGDPTPGEPPDPDDCD